MEAKKKDMIEKKKIALKEPDPEEYSPEEKALFERFMDQSRRQPRVKAGGNGRVDERNRASVAFTLLTGARDGAIDKGKWC